MGLIEDLGPGPVALDTVIFVYFIEEHPEFLALLAPLFEAIDRGTLSAVTSGVTLLETLVVPCRAGDQKLAEQYERILTGSQGIRLLDLERPLLRLAAQLRATTNIKTPDALQLAAAVSAGCSAFLTNDRRLPALPGIAILQLRDYTQA